MTSNTDTQHPQHPDTISFKSFVLTCGQAGGDLGWGADNMEHTDEGGIIYQINAAPNARASACVLSSDEEPCYVFVCVRSAHASRVLCARVNGSASDFRRVCY